MESYLHLVILEEFVHRQCLKPYVGFKVERGRSSETNVTIQGVIRRIVHEKV